MCLTYDAETSLSYNYFRTYYPGIGRYIAPDPLGLDGGINPYVYVENSPVNEIDRKGKAPGGWIPDVVETYDKAECLKLAAKWHEAAYNCAHKRCGDTLEDVIEYMESSGGVYLSTANLRCVCGKLKLEGESCAGVISKCMSLGVPMPSKPKNR